MFPTITIASSLALTTGVVALGGMAVATAPPQPAEQHSIPEQVGDMDHADVAPYTVTLGMSGYSPVSYIEHNRAEPGSPRYATEHDGVTYFFTDDSQRRTFMRDPGQFLPAYGGYCAFGCSVDSKFVPDPTSFKVIDGQTHLFLMNAEVDARMLWSEADPAAVRARADEFWAGQSRSRAYINARNVPASGVGLDGYSPVSYFTTGGPEKGDPAFAVEHRGVIYYLTSAAEVEMFTADPDRFEPQCGGWCAFGMAVEDKFPVDPSSYRVIGDRLYVFLNNEQVDALDLWSQGEERDLLAKAHAHWKKVSGE